MRIRWLTVIALGLVLAPAARGFVPLRSSGGVDYAWDLDASQPNIVSGEVTFYIGEVTSDSLAGRAHTAVRDGIHVWEQAPHTRIAFLEDSTRPASSHKSGDGVNLIRWVSGTLGPFTLATTYPIYSGSRITDADMLLNDDFVWATQDPPRAGTADVQSVVTHEWGHAIGLDHVTIESATLFYAFPLGAIYIRTLHADDLAAVAAIYPDQDFPGETCTIRGTVDVADRTNDRGVSVVAVDAVTGEAAVCALTEPDGSYAIRGLSPGTYRLLAAPYVPLAALNSYWSTTSTAFLAAPYTTTGESPGPTALVSVVAGQESTGHDLRVEKRDAPLEPDNSPAQATRIATGDSVAARLESSDDLDHFRIAGIAGRTVTVHVHSTQVGGDLDPEVTLVRPDGRVVNSLQLPGSVDIRGASYNDEIEGPDDDCRFTYRFQEDGDHLLVVSAQSWNDPENPFYVLNVTGGTNLPDAGRTAVTASPETVDADGSSTSTITVVPRNGFGDLLTDATVRMENSGVGTLGPVSPVGDGSFVATLTAPADPGAAPVTVTITTVEGVAVVPDAVTVLCVGPATADRSEVRAEPRRIPYGGEAQSNAVAVPRDLMGQPLGQGRVVVLGLDGPGSISAVEDAGDGSYRATVTAAIDESRAEVVLVSVDGVGVDARTTVVFGFDLEEVLQEVRDHVADLLASPATPQKSLKKLENADRRLEEALGKVVISDVAGALKKVVGAAKNLEKARRRSGDMLDLEPQLRDLAQAARETASEEIEAAAPIDPKQEKKLEQSRTQLDKGDTLFGEGKHSKAVKRYGRSYRKAEGL